MRLIDEDEVLKILCRELCHPGAICPDGYCEEIRGKLKDVPAADAVPVVRCKDCKHRPTGENRDDLEFPDETCPCQCEDFWYNWKPADNWFCGNGERKDGERHEG